MGTFLYGIYTQTNVFDLDLLNPFTDDHMTILGYSLEQKEKEKNGIYWLDPWLTDSWEVHRLPVNPILAALQHCKTTSFGHVSE